MSSKKGRDGGFGFQNSIHQLRFWKYTISCSEFNPGFMSLTEGRKRAEVNLLIFNQERSFVRDLWDYEPWILRRWKFNMKKACLSIQNCSSCTVISEKKLARIKKTYNFFHPISDWLSHPSEIYKFRKKLYCNYNTLEIDLIWQTILSFPKT